MNMQTYKSQILSEEDKELFSEIEKTFKHKAFRACYIMIWITCAESLKRRIKEIGSVDADVRKAYQFIEKQEEGKVSIDKIILQKAKEHDFITEVEYNKLFHIYEMRCVYAHPYEEKPSIENINCAIKNIVDIVLSKPIKYRKALASRIIELLINDEVYIGNSLSSIQEEAENFANRLDLSIYHWFIEDFWKKLEEKFSQLESKKYIERGIAFSQCFLSYTTIKFDKNEIWRDRLSKYKNIATKILSEPSLFKQLQSNAQNTIFLNIIKKIEDKDIIKTLIELYEKNLLNDSQKQELFNQFKDKDIIKILIELYEKNLLNDNQKQELLTKLGGLTHKQILSQDIPINMIFERVIKDLKSYNFYVQNPMADILLTKGRTEILSLSSEQKEILGRNILQSADGGARLSKFLLELLESEASEWCIDFILGIAFECFVNDKNDFRLKTFKIKSVCSILDNVAKKNTSIIERLRLKINESNKIILRRDSDFEETLKRAISIIEKYDTLEKICNELKEIYNQYEKSS